MTASAKRPVEAALRKARRIASRVPNRVWMSAGTLLFAVVGTVLLVNSHAATPTASYETEMGILSGNASSISDAGASGGAGIKFSGTAQALTCNLNATTANFAAQVSAATAGQVVCLATGNYGTWTGTNKAITVTAAAGATPTMNINFGSGANGFTLDRMSNMGGVIKDATNVRIQNSTFTSPINVNGGTSTRGIVISHNNFLWTPPTSEPSNAKIILNETATPTTGTVTNPAVTVEYNDVQNGDLDGVHIGGGAGMIVRNNRFMNLCDVGVNHTDNIQFEGATATLISGNYMYASQSCGTQGLTSFDSDTVGVIFENNVVDIPRDWGIEIYADKDSIVRHNTVVYHASPYSVFGHATGNILFRNKDADPPGTGTHAYDNVGFVDFVAPTTGIEDHNTDPSKVTYVGGANPTTHDGFLLKAGSVGKGAASDGTDTGIYAIGNVTYGPLP
ncbi:right-handed parallel beta-helix repeat-containing protein [Candidatus Saccharibacteria bacterium]|nr:MAG: right-handed parallel beta-helix repeat-containing protein [Candidatus Saccharibacteria bacterium]